MTTATKEMTFSAELRWATDGPAALTSGSRPQIAAGAPPEFGGAEIWWSPEHLLAEAANLCLMATFLAIARRSGLAPRSYASRAELTVEKGREGYRITRIVLWPVIGVGALEQERALALLELARKHCIVGNALKVEPEVRPAVVS